MRAFDQMEKAAKRRQQALERQKAHQPKSEESSEKSESASIAKEEDKVATASGSETQGAEDEKSHIPAPRTKKGYNSFNIYNPVLSNVSLICLSK